MVILILLVPACYRYYLISEAYNKAEEYIDKEAVAIENWIKTGKNGTAQAADDLTGLTSKLKYAVLSKEEYAYYAAQVIAARTHSHEEYRQRLDDGVADCIQDIYDVELRLADQMNEISALDDSDKETLQNNEISPHSGINKLVLNSVVEDITVAAASEGIGWLLAAWLAPETGGASFLFAIPIDLFLDWLIDTEGDLERKLNQDIDTMAKTCANSFKKEMKVVLEERKKMWLDAYLF